MKLSDAAQLCEGNSRAFAEVYKLYNYKDEDDLKAYCDFVIHEPVEWMRGFPAVWKSVTMFSKPRAAFHRLLKQQAILDELGETYCENVHNVIWNAFKAHMNAILEKRNGAALKAEDAKSTVTAVSAAESVALTAETFDSDILHPVPHVPVATVKVQPWSNIIHEFEGKKKNTVVYEKADLDYKHKFEVLHRVLETLVGDMSVGDTERSWFRGGAQDETQRLRAALSLLLAEFGRA